jgi:hypothetical protein
MKTREWCYFHLTMSNDTVGPEVKLDLRGVVTAGSSVGVFRILTNQNNDYKLQLPLDLGGRQTRLSDTISIRVDASTNDVYVSVFWDIYGSGILYAGWSTGSPSEGLSVLLVVLLVIVALIVVFAVIFVVLWIWARRKQSLSPAHEEFAKTDVLW